MNPAPWRGDLQHSTAGFIQGIHRIFDDLDTDLEEPSRAMPTLSLRLGGVLFEYKTFFRPRKPNLGYQPSPIDLLGMDFRVVALHSFLG